jgi:hypothetical protein
LRRREQKRSPASEIGWNPTDVKLRAGLVLFSVSKEEDVEMPSTHNYSSLFASIRLTSIGHTQRFLEKGGKNPKAIFCIKVKISAFRIRIVFPTEERYALLELHVSLKMPSA